MESKSSPHYQGFHRLSPNVWFRPPPPQSTPPSRPPAPAANGSSSGNNGADASSNDGGSAASKAPRPDLIVLCAWMAAAPRHVAKYIAGHDALFPPSEASPHPVPLLLVTCDVADVVWRSRRAQAARLAPAVAAVDSALAYAVAERQRASGEGGVDGREKQEEEAGWAPRVLLHVFSNGGAHTAVALARLHAASASVSASPSTKPWTLGAASRLALDSTPGGESAAGGVRALSAAAAPLPWPLRLLARALVPLVLLAMVLRAALARRPSFIASLRAALNDPALFPLGPRQATAAAAGRRVYLYSRADEMVGWRDVAAHAAEARGRGARVEVVEFAGTKHVGHAVAEPGRYWGAVGRVMGS